MGSWHAGSAVTIAGALIALSACGIFLDQGPNHVPCIGGVGYLTTGPQGSPHIFDNLLSGCSALVFEIHPTKFLLFYTGVLEGFPKEQNLGSSGSISLKTAAFGLLELEDSSWVW